MTRSGRSRIIAHASSRVSRFLRGSIVPTNRMNRSGRWRPTRGTSGNILYATVGVPSTDTPGGTYTVNRQSGRSTAMARRIWVVYTPTPAHGRARPLPSTATCKPVTELPQIRLVPLQHLQVPKSKPRPPHDHLLRVLGAHLRHPD